MRQNEMARTQDMRRSGASNPIIDFRTEFDRLFDDFWSVDRDRSPTRTQGTADWLPACDIRENSGFYLISVDVPGVSQKEIQIQVVDHQLRISGERRAEVKSEDNSRWYSERRFGRFERSFSLPENVDSDKMEAHFDSGVLRVVIPKAEAAKPREIKIQQGSGTGLFGRWLGKSEETDAKSSEQH